MSGKQGIFTEDSIGCIVLALAVIGGGYWAHTNYEIKKREQPPAVQVPPYKPPRPTGMSTVSVDKDGPVWRIDSDTVRGPRARRQGWAFVDNNQKKGALFQESRTLFLVDCDTMAVRELADMTYDKKGRALTSEFHDPEKASVKYFPPGSRGGAVVDYLCDPRFDGEIAPQARPPIVQVPSPKAP